MPTEITTYLWMVAGVLISAVLPPLAQYVRQVFRPTGAQIKFKEYGALFLWSALTALVLLAFYSQTNTRLEWFGALIAGYTWEATWEKIALSPKA